MKNTGAWDVGRVSVGVCVAKRVCTACACMCGADAARGVSLATVCVCVCVGGMRVCACCVRVCTLRVRSAALCARRLQACGKTTRRHSGCIGGWEGPGWRVSGGHLKCVGVGGAWQAAVLRAMLDALMRRLMGRHVSVACRFERQSVCVHVW
jgi:hypothetical protein